jgi:hypothetical protein
MKMYKGKRKQPILIFEDEDKKEIKIDGSNITAETTGTISRDGQIYIHRSYAGRKARVYVLDRVVKK